MIKPVYNIHAVKRMMPRRLSIDAIEQIAKVGVTVQENGDRVMKRGDLNGKPVHLVLVKPTNTVISFYAAD